ncbi:MAG: response regulator [Verrucomicrobiales bacterium]|nr:response regulator [Verrucomicrobiales bacterium]
MRDKSILVVEDSPTELQMVTNVLTDNGYQFTVATDGEEAIKKAILTKPALMLLDVVLPKKNGFQVCRQLKSAPETKGIKIIVLSSKNQDSDKYWGLRQGADLYITKPFKTDELLRAIAQLL